MPVKVGLWVGMALLVLLTVTGGCFSELQGTSCETDLDCFRNERCQDGECRVLATTDVETGGTSIGSSTTVEETTGGDRASISGSVVDATTSDPLEGVLVSTLPVSEGRRTDEMGQFQLQVALDQQQQYTMFFEKLGYEKKTAMVTVNPGGNSNLDVRMSPCRLSEEALCDGEDDDCDGRVDEGVLNGCGGCAQLPMLGQPCGLCNFGAYECADKERAVCNEDNSQLNVCGGCDTLTTDRGARCGVCDRGIYACDSEGLEGSTLVCDIEDETLNACGGCDALEGQPGEPCGQCGVYFCEGEDSVFCMAGQVEICGNNHDDDCTGIVDDNCE